MSLALGHRRALARWVALTATALPLGCLSYGDRLIEREFPTPEPESDVLLNDVDGGLPGAEADGGLPTTDPHALLGIAPQRGPFNGGQTVTLRGNGFGSDVRVWFGEVPGEGVIAVDPNRIQATSPPGAPGSVDMVVQNGDDTSTRRVLVDGYEYDAFTVEPSAGATTGGTLITLTAAEADWDDETRVSIDLEPCDVVEVLKTDEGLWQISCRVPAGSPGKKVVTVETADGVRSSVPGAFAYTADATEFEGGLSGDPLAGRLEVRVRSGFTGTALPGASVIVGSAFDERRIQLTPENGSVVFEDSALGDNPLGSSETVTVAMACMNPITLVDVPVDTVTLFLDPILTPACIPPSFDNIPIGGGSGAAPLNTITGELLWGEGLENRPGLWFNVPGPAHDDERQVAYVFELATSSGGKFSLPSLFDAVSTDDRGSFGYLFKYETRSFGNITLYALAGIEDRSSIPRRFTPYAMGVVRGVNASESPSDLLVAMDITLDHTLALQVEPPSASSMGPDRAELEVSLRMGPSGYIRLPNLQRVEFLPRSSPIDFVGVPALAGALERAEYTATVTAVSGPDGDLPLSHIDFLSTRQTDAPIVVQDFVPVPRITTPAANAEWDARTLALDFAAGGSFDLLRADVLIPSQTLTWRIIAPGARREIQLPPLAEFGLPLGSGRATVGVIAARVRDFNYATLKERSFGARAWSAHAADATSAVLGP